MLPKRLPVALVPSLFVGMFDGLPEMPPLVLGGFFEARFPVTPPNEWGQDNRAKYALVFSIDKIRNTGG